MRQVGCSPGGGGAVNSPGNWLAAFWLRRQVSLAVLLGRKRRSIELMQELLQLDPGDADSRNALGNLLMEAGEPAAAVEQFTMLLERRPENAEAWFNLGYIHESREDLANAERCFRRALELNPKIDRAWYGLGLTLIRGGRLAEAVDALKKNIELQPFSPYGYYQLGMTYHHLGQRDEALRIEAKLRSFEPKFAATLQRDIEQTPPAGAAAGGSCTPLHPLTKETIATPV